MGKLEELRLVAILAEGRGDSTVPIDVNTLLQMTSILGKLRKKQYDKAENQVRDFDNYWLKTGLGTHGSKIL